MRILNIGFVDVPLARHSPVKHLGPTRYFVDLKRNSFPDSTKGLTKPIPCDAAADWVQFRRKCMDSVSEICGNRSGWYRGNYRACSHRLLFKIGVILVTL